MTRGQDYLAQVCAAAGEGAEPVELTRAVASWPDSLEPAAFHGLTGEIVSTLAPHTEADPAGILAQLLTAFGSVVGRAPRFRVEADLHHVNLFTVLVGATSKGRKGSAWGHVRRLIEAVDDTWVRDRVVSGLSSGEGLIWAVRDPIEKMVPRKEAGRVVGYEQVLEDQGVSDKRLLVFEPEFAGTLRVMGRDGSTLSAAVRQAWDSGLLRTLTKNSPARATDAHIAIVGHVTADELRRYLDRTEVGNGFANRFLLICTRRSQCLPEGGRLDEGAVVPLAHALGQALDAAQKCAELVRDHGCRELWCETYPGLSAGRPGLLGAVTSRAEAQVLRLSMLYALLDRSRAITRPHLEAALAVWRYAEASARFVFGESLGDPEADALLDAIERAGAEGRDRTTLDGELGKHGRRESRDRALGALVAGGLVTVERVQTGGRPKEVYRAAGKAGKAEKGSEVPRAGTFPAFPPAREKREKPPGAGRSGLSPLSPLSPQPDDSPEAVERAALREGA